MTRNRDRLDEYVRQVTQLDDEQAEALADPIAKQALFKKISHRHLDEQPEPPRPRGRRPVRLVAVAAGVVAVVMALLASAGVLGGHNQPSPVASSNPVRTSDPRQVPERQGDAFGSGVEASCVEQYSPQTLAGRAFAFDGTVLSIAKRPGGSAETGPDPYVSVTFTVARWFRGGSGDRVTIAMLPPITEDSSSYTTGSRLLVSGADRWGNPRLTDPIAWGCGFTRWYNKADAQVWEQAFR